MSKQSKNIMGGMKADAVWNKPFMDGPAAPVVAQKWNTRFDWQPKNSGTAHYRAKGENNPFNSPVGMNAKKPY